MALRGGSEGGWIMGSGPAGHPAGSTATANANRREDTYGDKSNGATPAKRETYCGCGRTAPVREDGWCPSCGRPGELA